jgi:hypothetical protein
MDVSGSNHLCAGVAWAKPQKKGGWFWSGSKGGFWDYSIAGRVASACNR